MDPREGPANLAKHGVRFEEAETAFSDDFARFRPDPDHSEGEDRFLLLGLSAAFRVLLVVHRPRRGRRGDSDHLGPECDPR